MTRTQTWCQAQNSTSYFCVAGGVPAADVFPGGAEMGEAELEQLLAGLPRYAAPLGAARRAAEAAITSLRCVCRRAAAAAAAAVGAAVTYGRALSWVVVDGVLAPPYLLHQRHRLSLGADRGHP
jgi:hypothetical protein